MRNIWGARALRHSVVALGSVFIAVLAAAQAPAQTPALILPAAIAYDTAGNLYIADAARHQVFEATLGGQLVLIAGSGVQGFAGDGGPAIAAQLNEPQGLAVGADGTLYIADTGNQRIRAITGGIVRTIAGTGTTGFSGDGGMATAATLRSPRGMAFDQNGNLLFADTLNQRIRRIAGGVIQSIAGSGVQGFAGDGGLATAARLDTPESVAILPDGRIAIADAHIHRIRAFALDGTIATLAGTGVAGFSGDGAAAATAQLSLPRGITVLPNGDLVLADTNNQRVRLIGNGTITTLAGGVQGTAADATPATTAALNTPRAVAISSFGQVAVADTGSHTVLVIAANGQVFQPAALVSGRVSTAAFATPTSLTYGATSLPVAVTGNVATPLGQVQLLEATTVLTTSKLTNGTATLAVPTLSAGTHTLTAQYLGDGLNPASAAASFKATILQAATTVAASASANVAPGASLPITATVLPATSGSPTGSVTFLDSGTPIATASLVNGTAQTMIAAPAAGSHSIVASYGGDSNYFASFSPAVISGVGSPEDFTLASTGSVSQTILAGSSATYTFVIAATGGAFSGAVSMSVTGLPAGATASFTPPQVIPGAASAVSTLTIQTPAHTSSNAATRSWYALVPFLSLLFAGRRRCKRTLPLLSVMMLFVLGSLTGCGDRTASESTTGTSPQNYNLTVTGTATNALGALVTHATTVGLTVR